MDIYLITVGSRSAQWVLHGFDEYARRLPKHCCLKLIEVKAASRKSGDTEQVRREEGRRLMRRVPPGSHVIALAEHGQPFSTRALAEKMEVWMRRSVNAAVLVGGADGLDTKCFEQADECWSLSTLTFPHTLVRVIMAEQIYRAWTILAKHPYHRE